MTMNKLGVAVGALLMIGALAAPVAFAHKDSGNHPNPLVNTLFPGAAGRAGGDRVSGWYVTSGDVYLSIAGAPGANTPIGDGTGPLPDFPGACPADDPVQPTPQVNENDVCEALTSPVDPGFFIATFTGLGDVEVGGLGACFNDLNTVNNVLDATAVLNEKTVDGASGSTNTANLVGGAAMPDDLMGDGGSGFITHTDHYDCNAWNTKGCDQYADQRGEDLRNGALNWMATSCNWGIPVTDQPVGLDDVVFEFTGQLTNCPLGGFPNSCVDAVEYLGDCVVGPATVTPADKCAAATGTTGVICGNGSETAILYGTGAAGVPFDAPGWASASPAPAPSCNLQATASSYPFTAVIATAVDCGASLTPSCPLGWTLAPGAYVATATYGWHG